MLLSNRSLATILGSLFFVCVAACSSGTTTATADGGTPAGDGGDGGTVTHAVTLGGKSFVVASGLAKKESDTSLSLVLSDKPGVCEAFTAHKVRAGETILQAYSLVGTAPGTFKVDEDTVKYARVKSDCASGTHVTDNVSEASGTATGVTVTVTAVSATEVSGTIDATFSDGSFSLPFAVPTCAEVEPGDNATCE